MEKNKVRCTNFHWFDANKFSACPHCGARRMEEEFVTNVRGEEVSVSVGGEQKKRGLFGKSKDKGGEQQKDGSGASEMTEKISTEGMSYGHSGVYSSTANIRDEMINKTAEIEQQYPHTDVLFKPVSKSRNEEGKVDFVPGGVNFGAQDQGNTSISRKDIDEIKTISVYANTQGEEPVTGWLVGMTGEYKGRSFELKTGVNVIGRDVTAYVCLKKDAQVTRGKHATIIYEPKKKIFYLGEGENSLTYCNDELVCGKCVLNANDSIEIGGGTYRFVPFCGEQFDWDKLD